MTKGVYCSDYTPLAMAEDLAEDIGTTESRDRTGVIDGSQRARDRTVGMLRWDALVHGHVCLLDTTLFASPLFTSEWVPLSGRQDRAAQDEVLDRLVVRPGQLVALLRGPSLRRSMIDWIFTDPARLREPILHFAPSQRTSTVETTRRRAVDVQEGLRSLNVEHPETVRRMYDLANARCDEGSIDDFVEAVLEPYRIALDGDTASNPGPELGGFVTGYTWLLDQFERSRPTIAAAYPDNEPSEADTRTRSYIEELVRMETPHSAAREDRDASEAIDAELRSILAKRDVPVVHSLVQRAINDGLRHTFGTDSVPTELDDLDRIAATSARTPGRLALVRKRLQSDARYAVTASRVVRLHRACEAIRSDDWAERYPDISGIVPAAPQLAVTESQAWWSGLRQQMHIDFLALLGRISKTEYTQVANAFRAALRDSGKDLPLHEREILLYETITAELVSMSETERRQSVREVGRTAVTMFVGTGGLGGTSAGPGWSAPGPGTFLASTLLTAASRPTRELVATTVRSKFLPTRGPRGYQTMEPR